VIDQWGPRANVHLLALIRKLYGRGRRVPGRAASAVGMRMGVSDAGDTFAHNIGILVSAKNTWAAQMREAEFSGAMPTGTQQRAAWDALMGEAGKAFREDNDGPGPRIAEQPAQDADMERLRIADPLEWMRQVRPRVLAVGMRKGMTAGEIESRMMRYLRDGPR
jgi:hypothetical protein